MGRLVALGLMGLALALLGERFLALRSRLQASREVESIDLPNCRLIKGIEAGSEDIDILPNGLAFFSVWFVSRTFVIGKLKTSLAGEESASPRHLLESSLYLVLKVAYHYLVSFQHLLFPGSETLRDVKTWRCSPETSRH